MKWLHFDVIKIYTRTTLTRESRAELQVYADRQTQKATSTCKIMIPPTSLCEYIRLSWLAWSFYAALKFNQRHEKKCLPSYSTFSFNFISFFFAIWRAMNLFAMLIHRINNLILHFNERKFLWLNRCIVNAKQLTSMSEFLNFFFAQLWREYEILIFLLYLWARFYWIFIYFDGLSAKN